MINIRHQTGKGYKSNKGQEKWLIKIQTGCKSSGSRQGNMIKSKHFIAYIFSKTFGQEFLILVLTITSLTIL